VFATSTTFAGSTIDNVVVDGLYGTSPVASWEVQVGAGAQTVSINSLQIRNAAFAAKATSTGEFIHLFANATIGLMRIDNTSLSSVSGSIAPLLQVLSGATVNHLAISGLAVSGASGAYLIYQNGAVDDLDISNSTNATTARFLNITSTATDKLVRFDHVRSLTSDNMLVISSGVGAAFDVVYDSCDLATTAVFTASSSANVKFINNHFASATNGVIRTTGTPTINAYSSGNTLASGSWLAVPSGTPVVNIQGWDFQIDASTTGVNRQTGNFFYNTNAALGTLGAAGPITDLGTGSNSWHLLANPTLTY
jgi:hypothetical protein